MPHHPKVQQIGYVRERAVDPNMGQQLDGVELDKVFVEKISGVSIKRPKLEECLAYIRPGDTLNIDSMDRLARNLKDLQKIVEDLTKREIVVRFHKESLTFTNEANPMSKIMLQIMAAVAGFERALIKERQLEGIAKAKQAGKHLGRKPSLNDKQLTELKEMIDGGRHKTEVADHFKVSRQTIYRLLEKMTPTPLEIIEEKIKNGELNPKGPIVVYK